MSLTLCLAGCSVQEQGTKKESAEVVIPVRFLVNADTGENENEDLVKEFNQEYKGQYRVEVEWISDTAEGYRLRLKRENALDKLPAVITDVGFDSDFYQLLLQNGRLTDLKPYMEQAPEWQGAYDERVLAVCSEEDGSMYAAPSCNPAYSYAGFYYNKELFLRAGIDRMPDNWTDFFGCLETLKAQGITPLALHGGSSYWTPLLIATNYMAGTEAGLAFLNEQYPKDYNNESAKSMFALLKRLYTYADTDALKIERLECAKRFGEGKNAITANGGWMIMNFSEELKNKIGFAPFPGKILMEDPKMSAWAVTSGYSRKVTKGAAEFLKFRALRDKKMQSEAADAPAPTVVEREYREAVKAAEWITPNYQLKWEHAVQEDFFVNMLPQYVEGTISQEQFLELLNGEVKKIELEK